MARRRQMTIDQLIEKIGNLPDFLLKKIAGLIEAYDSERRPKL